MSDVSLQQIEAAKDAVSHPSHYTSGGIEFKYLWRWVRKNGVQDLKKCKQCIDFLIEEIEPKTTTETRGFEGGRR